ncbi:hypothetical protein [Pseudomonas sp.]|jgi:hypothetical protein|uniref:hypothetical protein n=1 Tax=Pseudomonas sp. TaxID=306 RepID=UPI002ED8B224
MLTNIPKQVNRVSRQLVLRHPNSMDCSVQRKTVNRSAETELGGLPTLGGAGVLDSEDEADFSFTALGAGRMKFADTFTPDIGNMSDDDTVITYAEGMIQAQVECSADPTDSAYFVADKHDLVIAEPGAGIIIPYEVVAVTSKGDIPPYTRLLLLNPREDLLVGI